MTNTMTTMMERRRRRSHQFCHHHLKVMNIIYYVFLLFPLVVTQANLVRIRSDNDNKIRRRRRNNGPVLVIDDGNHHHKHHHHNKDSNHDDHFGRNLLRTNEKQLHDTLLALDLEPESLVEAEFRSFFNPFDDDLMSLSMSFSMSMSMPVLEPTRSPSNNIPTPTPRPNPPTPPSAPTSSPTPEPTRMSLTTTPNGPPPTESPTICECPEGLALDDDDTGGNICYPPCPPGINGEDLIGMGDDCFYGCPTEGFLPFTNICFFDSSDPLQVQREGFETVDDCELFFDECVPCRSNPVDSTSFHPPCPDGFAVEFDCTICVLNSCPNGYTLTADMDGCEQPDPIDRSEGSVELDCQA